MDQAKRKHGYSIVWRIVLGVVLLFALGAGIVPGAYPSASALSRSAQSKLVHKVIASHGVLNDSVEGMGGHPQARTPNIDRLCRGGVRFLNAHSANPLCGPSRASLWTGLYPHTTGIYGHNQNNFTWRDSPVLRDAVTVFEHFAANGYTTYASGKIFHKR